MNGSPFLSRLNRPRSVSSGRQSNQIPEFDFRPVRPRNFSNSGRQSELDNSRHDRSLVKDSTGRQCLDLHEKDSFDTNDAGLVKNLTSDNYNVHIVNVGNTAIDTPHKENASFFSNNANVSTRESQPRTLSSGRQSPFIFATTRCNRPQPDCSRRRSPKCQSVADNLETDAFDEVSDESRPDSRSADRSDVRSNLHRPSFTGPSCNSQPGNDGDSSSDKPDSLSDQVLFWRGGVCVWEGLQSG